MKLHGSDITASENHCERKTEVKNSDPSLSYLNENRTFFASEDKSLVQKIDTYLEDFQIKIPRKDSVKCVELMLAAPPELFKNVTPQELPQNPIFNAWKEANYEFVRKEFKTLNHEPIINFYVHLDETSPHIHAHIIPLHFNEKTNKIELNAKAKFGGREKMQAFQDRYQASLNSNFQQELKNRQLDGSGMYFERGEPKELTGREHIKIKDYYKAIERAAKVGITPEKIVALIEREFPKSEISPSKTFDSDLLERKKGADLDNQISI
jgi:hypothetical protein